LLLNGENDFCLAYDFAIIDATPTGHLTLLITKTGKSYCANDFSNQFRRWCDDAGLPPECSFHGLRKAALTRLADAGKTVHQIAAVSGHKTLKEIERYTRGADQRRLAREALLGEQNGTESVEPQRARVSKSMKVLGKNR
jgi:integrase